MAKSKPKRPASSTRQAAAAPATAPEADTWLPAPKLRARLNISPPTFWRWRHNEALAFPPGQLINGRWYFQWGAVREWLAQRPQVRTAA